jgi:outer membrane biosynthesis protein TonB
LPHSLPEQFRVIAQHCLIRDPKLRCKTADIRQRLQPVQQDVVPSALQAEALVRQAPSAKRMVIAASMAAAVIAAAVAIPRLKEHSDEPKGAALPTPTYSAPTPQTVPPPTIMSEATQPVPATPVAAPTTAPIPVLMHPSLAGEKRLGPDSPALAPPPRHASVHVSEPASAPNEGEQAGIVRRVLPNVPRKALSTISGTIRVHITVTVGQEGNVSAAEFGSIGPSRYFANYAMDAAKQWRFSPSDSGLRAWNLQFDFKRSGVDVVASQAAR